jgi:transglutaminase-like putative cysteine protease
MSRLSPPSAVDVAVSVLAAAASYFTLLSWDGLSEDASSYLVPLFWIAAGVAGLGLGLRALRTPTLLVPPLQMLAVGLVLHQAWSFGAPFGGWLPTPRSVETAVEVVRLSAESTNQYATPVPAEATIFYPVMVVVGSAVVLCVDALAATLRRAPLAGLPLLAAFTVPVSLLGGVSWVVFALTATCYVLLLAAEQARFLGEWGRPIAGASTVKDAQPRQVRLGTLWPTAGRIGVLGVGVAVFAPLLLPTGGGVFDGVGGPGLGPGGNEVSLENPFVDIRRDLRRSDDIDLVEVRTDDPDPSYLRLTVLDEYDGDRWRPSERDIPADNVAAGELPDPPGLSEEVLRTEHIWELQVTPAFRTTWLPAPYPLTGLNAPGDWRYDADTVDFVSAVDDDAAGLAYSARGLTLEPEPRTLVDARLGPRQLVFENTRVPESVPEWVEQLAEDVASGASSNFERAVLLQRWFREDGGFEYTLERDEGNGVGDLERFLGNGPGSRRGYCEQFAAAMALMARSLGMPARVAVGFLSPEPTGDGRYVFSAWDLHAWPELYFDGVGWVRFEPTPQDRTAEPPGYTTGTVPQPELAPTPTAPAGAEQPTSAARPTAVPGGGAGLAGDSGTRGWLPWAIGAVLLAVVAVLAPRAVRELQRRARLGRRDPDGLVEGAWAELRATALDLGLGWDDGATLRTRARALVPLLGPASASAVEALERLVLLLERSRYAHGGLAEAGVTLVPEDVEELVEQVTGALHGSARTRAARRAAWLPASLWRGGPAGRTASGTRTTRAASAWRTRPGGGSGAAEIDRVSL